MRKNTIITMLMALAVALQWGCDKAPVSPTDGEISLRGGPHNDHCCDKDDTGKDTVFEYELSFEGDLFNDSPYFGIDTANTKKHETIATVPCPGPDPDNSE